MRFLCIPIIFHTRARTLETKDIHCEPCNKISWKLTSLEYSTQIPLLFSKWSQSRFLTRCENWWNRVPEEAGKSSFHKIPKAEFFYLAIVNRRVRKYIRLVCSVKILLKWFKCGSSAIFKHKSHFNLLLRMVMSIQKPASNKPLSNKQFLASDLIAFHCRWVCAH